MANKSLNVGKTFLVGLDGSEQSLKALEDAISLAKAERHDEFILLHIHSHENPEEAHKDMKILSDGEELVKSHGFTVRVDFIETKQAAGEVLVEQSKFHSVDYLVIGSRGVGHLRAALLGSVSDYCTHHAQCSVLVHRPEAL